MATCHDELGTGVYAGLLAEVLPAETCAADPAVLDAVHDELLDELAHPDAGGDWVETWRRIDALAHEGDVESWLRAVTAASEALRFVTELSGSSSLGLLHLADLVRVAWPHLAALGERGTVAGPVSA